jgi:hypothetical protein
MAQNERQFLWSITCSLHWPFKGDCGTVFIAGWILECVYWWMGKKFKKCDWIERSCLTTWKLVRSFFNFIFDYWRIGKGKCLVDLLLIQDLIIKIILFPFWRVIKTLAVQFHVETYFSVPTWAPGWLTLGFSNTRWIASCKICPPPPLILARSDTHPPIYFDIFAFSDSKNKPRPSSDFKLETKPKISGKLERVSHVIGANFEIFERKSVAWRQLAGKDNCI